jgi:hypothetical protein
VKGEKYIIPSTKKHDELAQTGQPVLAGPSISLIV